MTKQHYAKIRNEDQQYDNFKSLVNQYKNITISRADADKNKKLIHEIRDIIKSYLFTYKESIFNQSKILALFAEIIEHQKSLLEPIKVAVLLPDYEKEETTKNEKVIDFNTFSSDNEDKNREIVRQIVIFFGIDVSDIAIMKYYITELTENGNSTTTVIKRKTVIGKIKEIINNLKPYFFGK